MTYCPPERPQISAGDSVVVQLDPDVFMQAQQGHGGWNDGMAEVGSIVHVHNIILLYNCF